MSKATTFRWDPTADQTYQGDGDTLKGQASSFSKASGKSFTMDAAGSTLVLQVTPPGDITTWGDGAGTAPTAINFKRGTFTYDASSAITELWFGSLGTPETNLTIQNDARFIVAEPGPAGTLLVGSIGILNVNIQDEGVADIGCMFFALPRDETSFVNMTLSGMAQMAVATSQTFQISSATINVASAPASGYSLAWTTSGTDADVAMTLDGTEANFTGEASGLLKAPTLTLSDTRVKTADSANIDLQSDSIRVRSGSQFILGPGTAKMQFESYSPKGQPFDFLNSPTGTYPEGMFEISSNGVINGGEFLIGNGNAFAAARILKDKLIAIDGVPQERAGRVSCQLENDHYIRIRQIKP
ncbi:hypothetical protein [Bradyrhizobium sp. LHD-71]|uniref:hypothetical protein n=1 Tax=Bradyrhizobium sp. LHD-71 TaxID=3072141 RepID=UPI00280D1785|nr:hypothetical protein [Bradyrhizobium sp. LHD-71]MDQ8730019.1 hypothetical protein [Bradyrhizobium sp. LHD-71]